MKIASVIVTYNRLDKLRLTIEKTLAEEVDYVIVVDNASTDGTREWLDGLNDHRLRIHHLSENVGGAGGFHVGFKEASYHSDADWLVCYDDDAYPQTASIKAFKKMSLQGGVGSAAASVYLPSSAIAEMNRPSLNPFWHFGKLLQTIFKGRGGFHIHDSIYGNERPVEIDASSFVGYFVRTDVVRSVGLPRKELFIYADDIIYALSVRKAGYKHLFIPSVKFIHDSVTLVQQKPIYSPLWRAYYTYRNGFEMYRYTAGIFFYPIALLKTFLWWRKAKYYENPKLYKKVMWIAIRDGFARKFDRLHANVVSVSINN